MAIQTRLIDDIDGTADGVRTHTFAFDGVTYNIDLSEDNLERMRTAFAPYIAAGRRAAAKSAVGKPTTSKPAKTSGPDNATIRAWWNTAWQEQQLPAPNSHGRIPATIADAYLRCH
jgi:hypothetical protein